MVKVKVLNVSMSPSMQSLADKLLSFPYSDEEGKGFDLEDFNGRYLSAKYVERVVSKETVIAPSGEESEIEVVRYLSYCFSLKRLGGERCLMFIFNPPRSLKPLVSSLSAFEFGALFFSAMKLDAECFMRKARNFPGFEVDKVDKVRVKGVQISSSTYADVAVSSSSEAYNDMKEFVGEKSYRVSNVRMSLRTNFGKGRFEVSSSGLLTVDESLLEEVVEFSLDVIGESNG